MKMRKLLLALIFIGVFGVGAYAQNVPYSVETFLGPTAGKLWQPLNTYTAGINAQTGTTYTILGSDMGKLITFNNGGAIAVTLPQAGTAGFEANKGFNVLTLGAGTVTVTPTTSTINGGATKTYATGVGGRITSDGTNYLAY
jgi:hypothetical protein